MLDTSKIIFPKNIFSKKYFNGTTHMAKKKTMKKSKKPMKKTAKKGKKKVAKKKKR
jgi:hypothetical protein